MAEGGASINGDDASSEGWDDLYEDEESMSEDEEPIVVDGVGLLMPGPTNRELKEAVKKSDLVSLDNWRQCGVINANTQISTSHTNDEHLLTLALSYNKPEVAQLILADTHEISADLLFDCVRGHHSLSLIKFLVQNRKVNYSIQYPYGGGTNILHELVEEEGIKAPALVSYFIQAGCDINLQNDRLRTPIHKLLFPPAEILSYPDVYSIYLTPFLLNIRSLILAGCKMDITDYNNYTPLDYLLLAMKDYPRLTPLGEKILGMMAKAGVNIVKITKTSKMVSNAERIRRVALVKDIVKRKELHSLEVELMDREQQHLDSALNELFEKSPCDLNKICKHPSNQLEEFMLF